MAKIQIKWFLTVMLLAQFSGWQSVYAEDQPGAPPVEVTANTATTPPEVADAAQFQDWLKKNGHNTVSQDQSGSTPPNRMLAMANSPPVGAPDNIPPPKLAEKSRVINLPPRNRPPRRLVDRSAGSVSIQWDDGEVRSRPMSLKQSQAIMLKSAPPAPPPSAESTAAFNAMMKKNMPLSPEQVVKLRQLIDMSQRAASIPANVPPRPVSTTLLINLAPGTTPPAIRLAQGYVSSLVFVDSSGSPWPIASYDIGDPKATTIQWDGKSNIMLIQAISPYSDSNLVVRLVGLPTPVTLQLVSGQRVVDYRADIHVSGIGPNTKDLPTGVTLPNSANQLLMNILDGVGPAGGKQLTVTGGDCQAWMFGDKMYLRTRLTILSPGWIGKMSSPDGMNAYEMQKTSSVLVSQYGDPIELKIEGF